MPIIYLVRCINQNKTHVVEGQLRCKELSDYLDDMRAIKRVWISEDGTAIVARISYDPKTNQLVGLVLPLGLNGCPIPFR